MVPERRNTGKGQFWLFGVRLKNMKWIGKVEPTEPDLLESIFV